MILVDSSFLVAFFNKDDAQHDKAIENMKKLDEDQEEFLITEQVLGETATVLLYRNGLDAAKLFLEFSKEKCIIQDWSDKDFAGALEIFENQTLQLSYVDSTLVHLAKILMVDLVCYYTNILKSIQRK